MAKSLKMKAFIGTALLASASMASADTLREALVKAYQTNPTLTGARAGQRVIDENVPIARAHILPSANANATLNQTIDNYPGEVPGRRIQLGVNGAVPLYSGGGLRNQVRSAEARVAAGRANLLGTESDVFVATVTAYMDVLRDQAIVGLNQSQVKLLQVNLEATKDRFEVGDLTRTDVAQSEARLALADSNLQSAEAQLIASRERYVQIVGDEPDNLETPPPLPNMPTTVGQAVETALADNPDLHAANEGRKAAALDVKVSQSQRMPRVSGVANVQGGHYLGSLNSPLRPERDSSVAVGVQATMPLFSGGALSAQNRQSQARLSQSQEQSRQRRDRIDRDRGEGQ
jgi:outer membrane protein